MSFMSDMNAAAAAFNQNRFAVNMLHATNISATVADTSIAIYIYSLLQLYIFLFEISAGRMRLTFSAHCIVNACAVSLALSIAVFEKDGFCFRLHILSVEL